MKNKTPGCLVREDANQAAGGFSFSRHLFCLSSPRSPAHQESSPCL